MKKNKVTPLKTVGIGKKTMAKLNDSKINPVFKELEDATLSPNFTNQEDVSFQDITPSSIITPYCSNSNRGDKKKKN